MNCTTLRPATKRHRVLLALYNGWAGNRFDAERHLHDHTLHSTVAALELLDVRIDRHDESIPGFQGKPTHVKRYRMAPESRGRAAELLGFVETTRRAA